MVEGLICFAFVTGIAIWLIVYEDKKKAEAEKRIIDRDWISRDYSNIPMINNCPRCRSKAHLTTTVEIPSIVSKPGKLEFNKFDFRIVYSVRCNNCSLGTGNREEIAEVLNDWNAFLN